MRALPLTENNYDDGFAKLIPWLNKVRCIKNNDDVFILCIGETGTGKSMLGLHALEMVNDKASLDQVGLNPPSFARALSKVTEFERGKRFLNYDEGFVSKREWNTQFNRDVIKLYKEIRGQNIFHWICTPTAHDVDKDILERVDYLIYVISKSKKRPRSYIIFENAEPASEYKLGTSPPYVLKEIVEKFGDLKYGSLLKAAKKHPSWYLWYGWFRDYKGVLRRNYDGLKEDKGVESISSFADKWGHTDLVTEKKAAAMMGVSPTTMKKKIMKFLERGDIKVDSEVIVDPLGRYKLTEAGLVVIKELLTRDIPGGGRMERFRRPQYIPPDDSGTGDKVSI